eukprot:GHVR01001180.1.p1 GENE.GHVR01001180.1~~GHVR01001180.1.p1  ORF type:complete len:121 (+),score=60.51 GHVR01001180.1:178-540(+)
MYTYTHTHTHTHTDANSELINSFSRLGVLQSCNEILKVVGRDEIRPHLPVIYDIVEAASATDQSVVHIRKLIANCRCRVALGLLPSRIIKWRYQRGARSLKSNVSASEGHTHTHTDTHTH